MSRVVAAFCDEDDEQEREWKNVWKRRNDKRNELKRKIEWHWNLLSINMHANVNESNLTLCFLLYQTHITLSFSFFSLIYLWTITAVVQTKDEERQRKTNFHVFHIHTRTSLYLFGISSCDLSLSLFAAFCRTMSCAPSAKLSPKTYKFSFRRRSYLHHATQSNFFSTIAHTLVFLNQRENA